MRHEQLLQRRLSGRHVTDARVGEGTQERLHRPGHVALDRVVVDDHVAHSCDRRQLRRRPVELRADPHGGQPPERLEAAGLDDPTGAQHRHPIAHRLDLAQDVGRQQHRLAPIAGFAHAGPEDLLHQRVEPGGRLVEEQQVRPAGERGDEQDLLAVAVAVRPDLLVEDELEALDELVPVGGVDGAVQLAEEPEHLGARQRRPQVRLAGHVGQALVDEPGVAPDVEVEDPRPAGRRVDQAEQEGDRGRLAGPVRAEVAEHLALLDLEVERVEHGRVAVPLRQPLGADRRRHPDSIRHRRGYGAPTQTRRTVRTGCGRGGT